MNKNAFTTAAVTLAALAGFGLAGAGAAGAATPLGPTTNSCQADGAGLPIVSVGRIFIPDTEAQIVSTGVRARSIGTGSLSGDIPATHEVGKGLAVTTNGVGIATLEGTYLRGPGLKPCNVNGTFLIP